MFAGEDGRGMPDPETVDRGGVKVDAGKDDSK
jgi:hypothetical protein